MFLSKKRNGPTNKFGGRVPRDMKEALPIDQQEKSNLWKEAIAKEMTKIKEFEVFKGAPDGKPPEGHKKIPCHMIFDVKFDG